MTAPLLLLLALTATPPAPPAVRPSGPASPVAAAAARPVPTTVEADVIRYNWTTRKVTMVGKPLVTLTREDLTLTCRKLEGDNDAAGQLAFAVCEGDVKLVRGTRVVTCERGEYHRDTARIVCEGNPVLRDGETEARGKRLTYLLDADEVTLEEAVQATVPAARLDGPQKQPSPAIPGKPIPAAPRKPAPAAPTSTPPAKAPPAPAKPSAGGP
jgi:lipopolysaccharide export system protein LptA